MAIKDYYAHLLRPWRFAVAQVLKAVATWSGDEEPEPTYLIDESVSRHTKSVSQTVTIGGQTYAISDAFTESGHGTGSHWHNTSLAGPPAPALATVKRYAEVGGFFGDEEVRGVSEFSIAGQATVATNVLLKFVVSDLLADGISPDQIDGLFGQGALAADFNVVGFAANGTEELEDYQAAALATLATIDPTTLTAGQEITVDVTSYYNARRANGDTWLGIRLQLAVSDPDAGAITFEDFRLEITGPTTTYTDIPRVARKVLTFDGVNDRVSATVPSVVFPISMSAWFLLDTSGASRTILAVSDNAFGFLRIYYDGANLRVGRRFDGASEVGTDTIPISLGKWHHVVAVFEAANSVRVYLDGVSRVHSITSVSLQPTTTFLSIGSLFYNSSTNIHYWDGSITDVRILDRVLTASEICALYNATKRPGGDVAGTLHADDQIAWYPLEDGGGNSVLDHSGNGRHGTILDGTWGNDGTGPASAVNELGRSDYAIRVGGPVSTSNHVSVAGWADFNIFSADWTVSGEAWVDQSEGTGSASMVCFRPARLLIGQQAMYYRSAWRVYGVNLVDARTWSKFAVTFELATNTIRLYKNGALIQTLTGITGADASWSGLVFGQQDTTGNSRQQSLRNIRIFTQRLNDVEVAAFHSGSGSIIPLGWWKGTQGSGVVKEEMRGKDGTFVGQTGWIVTTAQAANPALDAYGSSLAYPGPLGKHAALIASPCVTFDGTNDIITLPTDLQSLVTTEATMALLLKLDDATPGSTALTGLESTSTPLNADTHYPYTDNDGYFSTFRVSSRIDGVPLDNALMETWHWLIVTTTPGANGYKVYQNKVLVASATGEATAAIKNPAFLGRSNAGTHFFDGRMAFCGIWNRPITQTEIDSLVDDKVIPSGPVFKHDMSEGQGLVLYDSAGGRTSTITGATSSEAWANTQDVYHAAINEGFRSPLAKRGYREFSGSGQYFSRPIAEVPSLNMAGSDDFWVAAWLNSDDTNTQRMIVSNWTSATNQRAYALFCSLNNPQFYLSTNGTSSVGVSIVGGSSPGVDQFLMAGWNGSAPVLSADGGGFWSGGAFAGPIHNSTAPFVIGAKGDLNELFDGKIRLVAVGKCDSSLFNTIRDTIRNGGNPLTYEQLTAQQKADWGITAWYDCDDWGKTLVDKHAANDLAGTGFDTDMPRPQATALLMAPAREYGHFNGTDQYFRRLSTSEFQVNGHVPAFWIAFVRPESYSESRYIFSKFSDTLDKREWAIALTTDARGYFAVSSDGTFATQKAVSSSAGSVPLNADSFLMAYHDPDADAIGMSVNGSAFALNSTATGGIFASDEGVVLGTVRYANPTNEFAGRIYRIAMFKPASSLAWSSVRDALYNGGTPLRYEDLTPTQKTDWGLVDWIEVGDYQGEGQLVGKHAGTVLTGSCMPSRTTNPSGKHHNVALTKVNFAANNPAASWVDKYAYAGYWTMNGLQTPIVADELLTPGYTGTGISVFARIRNVETNAAARNLLSLDGGSTVTDFIQFYIDVDDDLVVYTTTSHVLAAAYYTPAVAAKWHDFLFVVDGTTARVYVDGVQIGSDIVIAEARDWSDFTRVRLLTHPTSGANRFQGDVARLTIYPSAITPSQVDTADTVGDFRFDWDRLEDQVCRIPTQFVTGATPKIEAIPTAYQFGDTLGDPLSRQYTPERFETEYVLESLREPQRLPNAILNEDGTPIAWPNGQPIAFD